MSAGVALLALVLVACGPAGGAGTPPTAAPAGVVATAPAPLQDLRDVGHMQSVFEQDAGKTRLMLLVSPT